MKLILLSFLTLSQILTAGPLLERTVPRRVQVASNVIESRMLSQSPVPQYILDGSKCIASIRIVKAGFIWGGEASTGLVSCRLSNGEWSAPAFLNVGGVNWGLQIGLQFVDSVLTFMNDGARRLILNGGNIQLGVNASFAAGPLGQGAGAGVSTQAAILNYQKASGLYVGLSLNGLGLTAGVARNRMVYGDAFSQTAILSSPGEYAPAVVQPFVRTLKAYVR